MSENSKKVNSVESKGGFRALKNEFNKIMWPDVKTVKNKTIAVVAITVILATLIATLEMFFNLGLSKLLG